MDVIKLFVNKPSPVVVEAKEAATAEANLSTADAALKTETAVANAEAQAPRTDAQIDDLLSKGEA